MQGICFKEPLFEATIEGRKTQTRRIMKPQPQGCFVPTSEGYSDGHNTILKPKYNIGEILYLKEPYHVVDEEGATRYFIKITGVRPEILQDITDDDCIKEGIAPFGKTYLYTNGYDEKIYGFPSEAFAALIDKIYGKGTWKSNPYVWVYDYELTDREGNLKK